MIIRGWGGVLTSLTSTSLTLRNMYTLRMLLYDVVWSSGGWGGCINVLDEHFPYVTEHVHVAHAVVWSSGGWGGCINVLDEHFPYVTEHVHVAHAVVWSSGGWGGVYLRPWRSLLWRYGTRCSTKKSTNLQKRYTSASSWTWRHNAALLQSVASALPQALWHWSVEKRKKLEESMSPWYDSDDWKS